MFNRLVTSMIITFSLLSSVLFSMGMKSSSVSGLVNGLIVTGTSYLGDNYAAAQTVISYASSPDMETEVYVYYLILNHSEFNVYEMIERTEGNAGCGISFTAFDGFESELIYSEHTAAYGGDYWRDSTVVRK